MHIAFIRQGAGTWVRAAAAVTLAAGAASGALAQSKVLINPGDQGESSRFEVYGQWKQAIEQALKKSGVNASTVQLSTDATVDLQTTRSRIHDVFIAPAHVVGSAVRYGYTPLIGVDRPVQAVLVAPAGSGIDSLDKAKGKRLGMPLQDSVVTYLLRGEINAANTTFKRHFGTTYQTRYQDALLPCLQLKRCDVVAVEKTVFDRWVAAGEKLVAIMETRSAPGLSVAVRDDARIAPEALRNALGDAIGNNSEQGRLVSLKADDFRYVSTLGYFTPRSLPGAQVVDAATVAQMLARGARYIDTRTDREFKAGHVPGATLVPYVEKSPKDADYDASLDQFDLTKLGADRNAELIFACNGAECWKSFKASQAAVKAGFKRVYWFRGASPSGAAAGRRSTCCSERPRHWPTASELGGCDAALTLLCLGLARDAAQGGRVGVQAGGADVHATVDAQAVAAVLHALERICDGNQLGRLPLFQCDVQVALRVATAQSSPTASRACAADSARPTAPPRC